MQHTTSRTTAWNNHNDRHDRWNEDVNQNIEETSGTKRKLQIAIAILVYMYAAAVAVATAAAAAVLLLLLLLLLPLLPLMSS